MDTNKFPQNYSEYLKLKIANKSYFGGYGTISGMSKTDFRALIQYLEKNIHWLAKTDTISLKSYENGEGYFTVFDSNGSLIPVLKEDGPESYDNIVNHLYSLQQES